MVLQVGLLLDLSNPTSMLKPPNAVNTGSLTAIQESRPPNHIALHPKHKAFLERREEDLSIQIMCPMLILLFWVTK